MPFKPRCVYTIARVPKKDSGISCPITDFSCPLDRFLNDYIKCELESFRMNSIDNAIAMSEPGYFYSIVDIESAWRWVPVFPPHRELQGFAGCPSSQSFPVSIFCRQQALFWIVVRSFYF